MIGAFGVRHLNKVPEGAEPFLSLRLPAGVRGEHGGRSALLFGRSSPTEAVFSG